MRLKHLRDLLKLSEEQMAAQLVMPVERYREIEAYQGDQHVSAFEVDCDPLPSKETDMFNTEPVLRRLLSTSNHAVQIQIEENQKLRQVNMKLKRYIVRSQLTNNARITGEHYCQVKLDALDYLLIRLMGINKSEADELAAEIQAGFIEDEE